MLKKEGRCPSVTDNYNKNKMKTKTTSSALVSFILEKKYQIELTLEELETVKSALRSEKKSVLRSEKKAIYGGSSTEEHKAYRNEIDSILGNIFRVILDRDIENSRAEYYGKLAEK